MLSFNTLIVWLTVIFIIVLSVGCIRLYSVNTSNIPYKKKESFLANQNVPQPSINFDYLSDPNYTNTVLNNYYIDNDMQYVNGRYKYGNVPHHYRYKHSADGYRYYYGMIYNPYLIQLSDDLYNRTGIRY